jgi:hypothetical protein
MTAAADATPQSSLGSNLLSPTSSLAVAAAAVAMSSGPVTSPTSPPEFGRRPSIAIDPKPLLNLKVVNKTDRSIWVGIYEGDDQLRRIALRELKVRSEWELKNLGGMTQVG